MVPESIYEANLRIAESCANIDGSIVECGVWRGGMIAGIANVLGPARTYYLCDSFEGLPQAKAIDGPAALAWQANPEGESYRDNCRAEDHYARRAMELAGVPNYHLVRGWFADSLPTFRPDGPIALLRMDADWFESTMVCLQSLSRFLAADAIVVVDDYSTWDGCAQAVHEFLAGSTSSARIETVRGVTLIRGLGKTRAPDAMHGDIGPTSRARP